MLIMPFFAWLITIKHKEPDFNDKFGTLTDEINLKSNWSKNWNVLMLLRWAITVMVLLTMSEYQGLQVLFLLSVSLFY
jgi:hypothetical protein